MCDVDAWAITTFKTYCEITAKPQRIFRKLLLLSLTEYHNVLYQFLGKSLRGINNSTMNNILFYTIP